MRLASYMLICAIALTLLVACCPLPQATSGGDQATQATDDDTATEDADVVDQPETTDDGITDIDGDGIGDTDIGDAASIDRTDPGGTVDASTIIPSSGSHTTMSSSGELPEGWPEDIPIMEGLMIRHGNTVMDAAGVEIMMVLASGNIPPEEIADFYRDLPGWQVTEDSPDSENGAESIGFMTLRDQEELNVVVAREEETTSLTLVYTRPTVSSDANRDN